MKKNILFQMIVIVAIIASCTRADIDSGTVTPVGMENLLIADNFNFESTKSVELNINLPFTVDFSTFNSRVSIYDKSPDDGGMLLHSGSANNNGVYNVTLIVPSYLTELFVRTMAGDEIMSISDNPSLKALKSFTIDFGEEYSTGAPRDTTPESTQMQSFVLKTDAFETVSGNLNLKVVSQNLIGDGSFDTDQFGADISLWSSAMSVDGLWHRTSQLDNEVDIYNDNGNNVLRISKSNYRYGGVAQLINASAGDLITLSAKYKALGGGNKVGWLFIIARNASGSSIGFYSRQINSSSSNWKSYTVAATMPNGTASVQILLWQHIFGGNIFWDDVVVTGPITDTDGDGVNDEEDDYPNDSQRAYNIYYPNEEDFGSLAFEDNWPGRGDYDFNDLVVDYQFKQIVNGNNALVELESKFKIRAIGASFTNGFGYQMEMPSSSVASITGQSIVDSYINLNANNTESGQAKATIIVTDNAFTQLPHPGGGTGVNTTPGQTYVEPTMMTIFTTLTSPVPLSQAGSPPYNPFIIVDQIRGREVHLPNYRPTTLANTSLFNTQHDDTTPGIGKYYKTNNNLPWAINIPVAFEYPVEKALIINAYLHFAEWAESSGSLYANWYLDETGYRNSGNIF